MSTQSPLRRAARALPLAPCVLVSALMLAFPAAAQSNAALQKELRDLQQRLSELEAKLKAAEDAAKAADASAKSADASAKSAAANKPQWGMTPEQAAEFNRIAVKTEAMEDARDAAGLKGLKFSGYMDPSFVYNKNQKRFGAQFLNRVEDDGYNYDNSYFGAVALDLLKETDSGLRWHLTLAPSRGVGSVFDTSSIVQEATVSIPLSDLQTRFIAGQIPDWSGYEYLQPTLNKLTTHNLLFDFTLPTAYTGAGVDITTGKLQSKAMIGNMNATKKAAGEKSPMFALRGDYTVSEYLGFGYAGVLGKAANLRALDDTQTGGVGINPVTSEPYSTRETSVRLLEVDGYYTRSPLTLQGQFSVGQQSKAAVTADPDTGELRNAKWWGFSVLAAYKFDPRFEGIARIDYINNSKNGGGLLGFGSADGRNGIGPGSSFDETSGTWVQNDPNKGGNRTALTVGMGYAVNTNTTFKAEYRIDRSSVANFEVVNDGGFKKSNQLLATSVVVSF